MRSYGSCTTDLISTAQPGIQVFPLPQIMLPLGLGFGLFLGCVFAFVVDVCDPAFRTELEVVQVLGLPVFGEIPVTCGAPEATNWYWPIAEPNGVVTVTFTVPDWLQVGEVMLMPLVLLTVAGPCAVTVDPPGQGKLTVVTAVPSWNVPSMKLVPEMVTGVATVVRPWLGPTPFTEGPPWR